VILQNECDLDDSVMLPVSEIGIFLAISAVGRDPVPRLRVAVRGGVKVNSRAGPNCGFNISPAAQKKPCWLVADRWGRGITPNRRSSVLSARDNGSTFSCQRCVFIAFWLPVVSNFVSSPVWSYRLRHAADRAWGSVANADAPLAYEEATALA